MRELTETKKNILQRLHDNIVDQVKDDSIFFLLNVFDLNSRESIEEKIEKIRKLYNIYGKERSHQVKDKWFDFNVIINYLPRIRCTEEELVSQFTAAHEKISILAREYRERVLSQYDQWCKFIASMDMQSPDLCDLVVTMMSVPPNSGWVERAYSYLEQICQKKRNRMTVEKPLKELFFLALLKLDPKPTAGYTNEIKILSGEL